MAEDEESSRFREGYNPVGWVGIVKHSGGVLDTTLVSSGDIPHEPRYRARYAHTSAYGYRALTIASGMCDSSCHGNPYWYDDITFKSSHNFIESRIRI